MMPWTGHICRWCMIKFENKTNGRFYYLVSNTDILNDLVLTVIRGGIHSRVVRHYGFNNRIAIQKEIDRITRIRIRRGYTLVE